MRLRTDKQFRAEHQHALKNPPASYLSNPYACKLEGFDYLPNGSKFIPKGNDLYLNIYQSNPLVPVPVSYTHLTLPTILLV